MQLQNHKTIYLIPFSHYSIIIELSILYSFFHIYNWLVIDNFF